MESKGFFRGSIGCSVTVIFQLAVSPISFAEKAIDIAKPKSDIATLSDAWGCHQLAVETVVSLSWTNETVVETAPKKTVETAPLGFFHTVETVFTSSSWVMQHRETKGKWDCWHAETAAVGWTESREGPKSWEMKSEETSLWSNQLSNERKVSGCLGFIGPGDEILPS